MCTSRFCVKFCLENRFLLCNKLKGRPLECQHPFKDENSECTPHQCSPGKGPRSCEGTDLAYIPDDEQGTPSSRCSINTRWPAGYVSDHVPQEIQEITFPQVLEKQILSFIFGGCTGTSPKDREGSVVPSGHPCKLQGLPGRGPTSSLQRALEKTKKHDNRGATRGVHAGGRPLFIHSYWKDRPEGEHWG